ncbi:MAG: hypothetical protein MUE40_05585 [Anaerolineae bacterium]|nr:hypothetical protein [Anaerolineae bacterium]
MGRLYNPFMIGLLLSPLHGLVSRGYLLLLFRGRKSDRQYTVPVEYFEDADAGTLYVFTALERVWWKNLQAETQIMIGWRGKTVPALARAITDDGPTFNRAMQSFFRKFPGRARFFGLTAGADGSYAPEAVAAFARQRVVIVIRPQEEAARLPAR